MEKTDHFLGQIYCKLRKHGCDQDGCATPVQWIPAEISSKWRKFQLGALRACNGELMFYPQIILQSPFSWGVEPLDFSYINLCLLGTLDIRCSFISFISHLAWVYMPLSQFFCPKKLRHFDTKSGWGDVALAGVFWCPWCQSCTQGDGGSSAGGSGGIFGVVFLFVFFP